MKRSVQEIIELAVFGLIALLIGIGVLYGVGWVLTGAGWLLRWLGGIVLSLLRFIVPIAVLALLVYLLVVWLRRRDRGGSRGGDVAPAGSATSGSSGTGSSASGAGTAEEPPARPQAEPQTDPTAAATTATTATTATATAAEARAEDDAGGDGEGPSEDETVRRGDADGTSGVEDPEPVVTPHAQPVADEVEPDDAATAEEGDADAHTEESDDDEEKRN